MADEIVDKEEAEDEDFVEESEEKEEEEKEEKEEEKEEKEEEEEKESKEENEERSDEEEIDEELPQTEPVPQISVIKKEFPELFKKFPGIRDAIIRADKYSREFPTIKDAAEAKEKAETFDFIDEDISTGNAGRFLGAVRQYSPEVAKKFVNNIVPQLYQVDKDLYFDLVTPIVKRFVAQMHGDGKKNNNENLTNAALLAMQWAGFEDGKSEEKPKEDNRVNEQLQRIEQERFQSALNDVDDKSFKEVEQEIDKLLEDEKGLSKYEKRSLRRDIIDQFNKDITQDRRHMQLMTDLWKKASKAGYSREWKDRISTAYLSRAKLLLPSVAKKVRKELFGDRVVEKKKEEKKVIKSTSPATTPKKESRGKMKTDLEIFQET